MKNIPIAVAFFLLGSIVGALVLSQYTFLQQRLDNLPRAEALESRIDDLEQEANDLKQGNHALTRLNDELRQERDEFQAMLDGSEEQQPQDGG